MRLSTTSSDSTTSGDSINHTIEQEVMGVFENLKKIYPPKEMKDISVSFCFICLLHLVNETSGNC